MLTQLQVLLADQSLRTKGLLVVLIPLMPLILTAVFISMTVRFEREAVAAVHRTQEVESDLQTLTTLLVEAEAGVRAFLLSGDERWLEAQRTARQQRQPVLGRLERLIVDPEQQSRLRRMPTLIDRRLEALNHVVTEARSQGQYPAVESRTRFEQGRDLMTTLRTETAAMLQRQRELLAIREIAAQRTRRFLLIAAWLGTAFGVAGSALAVMLFTTSVSSRIRALEVGAEHLARGEALPVMPRGRDEVGMLGHQLHQTAALLAERDQALRQAHRALDRFFTLSLDLFCVAGFDGYFKRLNPTWRDTLGWSDEQLYARPFLDFVHPDDRESTSREAAKLGEGGVTVEFENRYRCQDGSYRWLEWMAVPVLEERQIYAMARDITGRKEASAELAALNSELAAFSYSVSHDLRAPLRSIDGFSQVLLEDYGDKLDEEGKDSLQRVRAGAARMSALIDALLVLSRVGRAELRAERVDLTAMAYAIGSELRRAEPARQVEFVIQPGMFIDGDPRLLRAALDNLLGNAWKFTQRRGAARIEFGCVQEAHQKVYFVRDNGVGFDMAYAGKLFGAFQRLHDERQFSGTGVGLATVQRIIHRHGGRTWAEGAVDRGATFYFTLGDLVVDDLSIHGSEVGLATADGRRTTA